MEKNVFFSISVSMAGDVKRSERSPADAFLEALDGLSRSRIDLMEKGIEGAKHRLTLIMNQVVKITHAFWCNQTLMKAG